MCRSCSHPRFGNPKYTFQGRMSRAHVEQRLFHLWRCPVRHIFRGSIAFQQSVCPVLDVAIDPLVAGPSAGRTDRTQIRHRVATATLVASKRGLFSMAVIGEILRMTQTLSAAGRSPMRRAAQRQSRLTFASIDPAVTDVLPSQESPCNLTSTA